MPQNVLSNNICNGKIVMVEKYNYKKYQHGSHMFYSFAQNVFLISSHLWDSLDPFVVATIFFSLSADTVTTHR